MMFCPKCGQSQQEDLNYCKACGAHLQAVRTALERPADTKDLDWNRTWLAEAMMTRDEKNRRRGITPEMKRRREIKAGIITASAGIGLSVVLAVLMEAIVLNGNISALGANILSRLWIVGLIPIMVGSALIFNGAFISHRGKPALKGSDLPADTTGLGPASVSDYLTGDPSSVTEHTTRHLEDPVQIEKMKTK